MAWYSGLHHCLLLQGSLVQIPLRASLSVLFFVFKSKKNKKLHFKKIYLSWTKMFLLDIFHKKLHLEIVYLAFKGFYFFWTKWRHIVFMWAGRSIFQFVLICRKETEFRFFTIFGEKTRLVLHQFQLLCQISSSNKNMSSCRGRLVQRESVRFRHFCFKGKSFGSCLRQEK